MIIGKMSIVQNFHGYSDTVVVVVAVGEVDGVADIWEKNKLISILIWMSSIFGLVETVETARLITFFLLYFKLLNQYKYLAVKQYRKKNIFSLFKSSLWIFNKNVDF